MGEVRQPTANIVKLPEGEEEEHERFVELLEERLMKHDENRKAVQDKLHNICEGLRAQVDELEDRINKELEEKFISEDNRLQTALNELRGNRVASALWKAKAELLVEQSYEILENKGSKFDLTTLYKMKTEKRIVPELVEAWKPTNVCVTDVNRGSVSVKFACLNPDEERVSPDNAIVNPIKYKYLLFKKDNEQESKEYLLDKNEGNNSFLFTPDTIGAETTYGIRVKIVVGDRESEWSDVIAEFSALKFEECCAWKTCPDYAKLSKKYSVDGGNPRVATKINSNSYCTIIGNTYIPLSTITSWNIKIHKSRDNNGSNILIGVTPFDVNQDDDYICNKCGWYFYCCFSTLYSGPPHYYDGKEYGPRKDGGQYVHTGDSVGVVMDTTRGDLSFVLNGVNHGVAYEGIPLDKPFVPCVIFYWQGDSVELTI